jgi:predicted component of type VI protein secretion system
MIGRDKTACKIVFSDNAQGISRHHCLISYSKQTRLFILNDVGSSNGTFVEKSGEVLKGNPAYLKSGERFYLGSPINTFETRI